MKVLSACAALLAVLALAPSADACMASDVYTRAIEAQDSVYYDTVRTVVMDTIQPDKQWEREEAIDAAIGTILREYACMTQQNVGEWDGDVWTENYDNY
jgi:hypothetical protein